MVGLNLHIYRDQAVLSLDSSGESLHKRGYRPILTRAPLNEALAAALVLLTGWRGATAFVDPLCGSGTLPIEAAWIALRRPPGLTRRRFGFQGWMDFDVALWTELRDEARRGVLKQLPAPIVGSDVRGDAVAFAIDNARAAGIGHLLRFEREGRARLPAAGRAARRASCAIRPTANASARRRSCVGCTERWARCSRQRCAGWTAYVFTGNATLAARSGCRRRQQYPLFNGKIPCRLLKFVLE